MEMTLTRTHLSSACHIHDIDNYAAQVTFKAMENHDLRLSRLFLALNHSITGQVKVEYYNTLPV